MSANKFTKMVLISEQEYAKCFKKKSKQVVRENLPSDQKIKIVQKQAAINREKIKPMRRIQIDKKKWQAL